MLKYVTTKAKKLIKALKKHMRIKIARRGKLKVDKKEISQRACKSNEVKSNSTLNKKNVSKLLFRR